MCEVSWAHVRWFPLGVLTPVPLACVPVRHQCLIGSSCAVCVHGECRSPGPQETLRQQSCAHVGPRVHVGMFSRPLGRGQCGRTQDSCAARGSKEDGLVWVGGRARQKGTHRQSRCVSDPRCRVLKADLVSEVGSM